MTQDTGMFAQPARRTSLTPVFVGSIIALVLILLGVMVPSPYIIEKPGPVVNTLGEITVGGQTQPIVLFDGKPAESDAVLNLLTVSIVGSPDDRLGWLEVIPALFDPRQELVPIERFFSPGETAEDRDEANQAMMQSSQMSATAAAFSTLGVPFEATVTVENIVDDSPASGVFKPGDVITHVNDTRVTGMSMVRDAVVDVAPGGEIDFTIERDGHPLGVQVAPAWNPATHTNYVGIVMGADYTFTHDISFDVDRIGGPSAGMIFALAMIEELGSEDLVGSVIVSGTGTVDDAGNVGAIGGLTQKIWAADAADSDVFLMPVANCQNLPERRPADMPIVPVATVHEAVTAIRNARDGKENVGIERCQTELAQVSRVG